MAKKINKDVEQKALEMIKSKKFSKNFIAQHLGVSFNYIFGLCKKNEIHIPRMITNNSNKDNALKGYKKMFDEHSYFINEKVLKSGWTKSDLMRYFCKSQTYFDRFFMWYPDRFVVEKLKQNAKISCDNHRRNVSSSGSDAVRRKYQKLLEDKKEIFIQMKEAGVCQSHVSQMTGWSIDVIRKLSKKYGQLEKFSFSGSNNPMFGRQPRNGAGRGKCGWVIINDEFLYFRSILELKILLYLQKSCIDFTISGHKVSYKVEGKEKNYFPDIVIENKIFEIKPKKLTKLLVNKRKQRALKDYCKKFNLLYGGYITEKTYPLKDITADFIVSLLDNEKIILNKVSREDFIRVLKEYYED